MEIREFLLARIAEDEENAGRYVEVFPDGDVAPLFRRVLAECAAKRAIIGLADDVDTIDDALMIETMSWKWETSAKILGALAAVYSDHPDYQQECAL